MSCSLKPCHHCQYYDDETGSLGAICHKPSDANQRTEANK
jgi:hypothetical protein